MKYLVVRVLEHDIQQARLLLTPNTHGDIKLIATLCPISLAVKRQLKQENKVWVTEKGIFFDDNLDHPEYECSTRAVKFIEAFDSGESVLPQKFRFQKCS